MSSTMANNSRRSLIALCQLTSKHDIAENLETCKQLINRAGERNCKVFF